jgi:hypothetical protein
MLEGFSSFPAGSWRHEEAQGEIRMKQSRGLENFIPEAVDQRTLQICHVEATHCIVSRSIDVTIDQILFRNKSVTRGWCGRTIPSIPGFF